jgi:hypothetical protein
MKSWQKLFNNDNIVSDDEYKKRKRKKLIDKSIEPDTVFNEFQNFKISTTYINCDDLAK